jgi:hypothetical protein
MPPSRSDARLLLGASAAVFAGGVLVAIVLLFASGSGSAPKHYVPFQAGDADSLARELRTGGPFFVADPFGGNRSILFALEDGKVVALSNVLPGTKSCSVRWRGSINSFQDCHGAKHASTDLDRYQVTIDPGGAAKGQLFVDLREKIAAPG